MTLSALERDIETALAARLLIEGVPIVRLDSLESGSWPAVLRAWRSDPVLGERGVFAFRHHGSPGESVLRFVEALESAGVTIESSVPYGMTFGPQPLLSGSLAQGRYWNRLLSWTASEPRLRAFFLFLEVDLASHLPITLADRFLAVLSTQSTAQVNAAWLRQQNDGVRALTSSRQNVLRRIVDSDPRLLDRFVDLLAFEPNRVVLFSLLDALQRQGYGIDFGGVIPIAFQRYIDTLMRAVAMDRRLTQRCDQWLETPAVAGVLTHRGISLGPSFLYDLIPDVLRSWTAIAREDA